jgi:hypothetical protein
MPHYDNRCFLVPGSLGRVHDPSNFLSRTIQQLQEALENYTFLDQNDSVEGRFCAASSDPGKGD